MGSIEFGRLSPERTMRQVIPSGIAILLAFQIAYQPVEKIGHGLIRWPSDEEGWWRMSLGRQLATAGGHADFVGGDAALSGTRVLRQAPSCADRGALRRVR
jgi:hypothetical protein